VSPTKSSRSSAKPSSSSMGPRKDSFVVKSSGAGGKPCFSTGWYGSAKMGSAGALGIVEVAFDGDAGGDFTGGPPGPEAWGGSAVAPSGRDFPVTENTGVAFATGDPAAAALACGGGPGGALNAGTFGAAGFWGLTQLFGGVMGAFAVRTMSSPALTRPVAVLVSLCHSSILSCPPFRNCLLCKRGPRRGRWFNSTACRPWGEVGNASNVHLSDSGRRITPIHDGGWRKRVFAHDGAGVL